MSLMLRCETLGMAVKTDFSKIEDDIKADIQHVVDYSQRKGDSSYTQEAGDKDIAMWTREAHDGFAKFERVIEEAISSLPNWGGSSVVLEPLYNDDKPINWEADEPYVVVSAHARLYKGGGWRNAPGFTIFYDDGQIRGVDDVLDAGDTDFFDDPAIEADYFMLTEELRHPGAARRLGGKVITLFTARPAKDRRLYDNARQIPTNVFLTTSEDEAYGYIADSGGGRDVYMVKIKRMYLVETLDAGSKKNYQTFSGSGRTVPVEECTLVYESQKLARRVMARWLKGP